MIITLQTLIFFRESLLNAFDRLVRPYYNTLSLVFGRNPEVSDDDESDEQVFAEFDEEKGVVFYPPVYLQRYAAVSDCIIDERWCGKLEKIVELGYHDMSFIKYLKEMQGIKCILGVDIESIPLHCSMDLIGCDDYKSKREKPLEITLFKGNAADPDYRLIGCDAVVSIEMIEHMLPHDLDRLIHTVFGFIKPQIAIFTTPNGDFNVLFKALEKNGLRRLDHFFEWSREQFHDWCSNIVIRYPQYTVSCKGIGPGPNGTKHLGCCSQMALFVAKEYHKQQDLNLNSLALVSGTPCPKSISNLISTWDSTEISNENNMIEPAGNIESYSELYSEKQSSITIILSKPPYSLGPILYQDKNSQCNLDTEIEKNYLMFDYDKMCLNVIKPNRNVKNRVYYIEDVYNRLNCTTLEVKKFSKTTQNLMAKNKLETQMHTREVVDEIRNLTKLLNFNKESKNQLVNGTYTWCNINWGENAPYWNQYYKIVKEYTYPFEIKSDESRILDLISDEINRLIDAQFDEDFSIEGNKLEIPIDHLMKVVEHITDDVEKVKDLLVWNGYELVGNVVIHSRLAVDYSLADTQEEDFQSMDIYSDWDSTDIHSTSMYDGSTIVPDYHARGLRRALDEKVRKLRSMLTEDEDITTELDKVICRLMKLALRTSTGRKAPPPTKWMLCKLLDLLTLTEKAIERRKMHFIDNYSLKAINYEEKSNEMFALEKIKEDDTALKIVDKYEHLINKRGGAGESQANYRFLDFGLDDDLSISSAEFAKEFEFTVNLSPNLVELEDKLPDAKIFHANDVVPQAESKLERTQAWVEEDIEVVPYPDPDGNLDNISVETEKNNKFTKYYKKKYKGKPFIELNCVICKKSHSKAFKQNSTEETCIQNSKTKLVKKGSRKKSSHGVHVHTNNKYVSVDYKTNKVKPRRKQKSLYRPATKDPIPDSLIDLCDSEIRLERNVGPYNIPVTDGTIKVDKGMVSYETQAEVADTKQSLLIDIVTDDAQETIALRRTIGTDADADSMAFEDETLVRSFSNTLNNDDLFEKHNVPTENVHSQTIFLYDIDEPTTSKGIRHVSMDVQCGPDVTVPVYSMLSATTSLTMMPKMFTAGIKIGNSTNDTVIKSNDFGTSISADNSYKTIVPRKRSVGIKIKDSDSSLSKQLECSILPAFSMVSATTSLTRMSHVSTAGIRVSTTDIKMKSTKFCTFTNNAKSINLPIARSIDIKIKTKSPKELLFSRNTQNSFDTSSDVTKIVSEFPLREELYGAKTENFQPLKKLSPLEIQKQICGVINLGLNLPREIECSTNTEEFYDNKTVSLQQKSVGFKLKTNSSDLTKASKYPITTQESSSIDFVINDPGSKLLAHMQSSTDMHKSHYRSNTSSPQSPHQTETTKTTLLKLPSELKNDDSMINFYVSDDGCGKIQTPNTLQTSGLHVESNVNQIVGGPERLVCKYTKPKLCKGGVQVHSYRDKQTHSEDVMYQGEWQRNRPKVLTRKKMFNPLAPKNINVNLKKKANSKEKIKIKSYPKEKNRNKNSVKRDVQPEIRRALQPRKTTQANLKQESDKNGIKQNLILPKTAGVATLAKPFRNILKVPSKFPMSYSPDKKLKSQSIVKQPPITSNQTVTKDDKTLRQNTKKDYIPLYLKQRTINSPNDKNKKDPTLSLDSAKSEIKNNNESTRKPLIRSKTDEIVRDLVKFQTKTSKLQNNVYYNEIEKKKSDGQHMQNRSDSSTKRTSSPNSSTCSSPSSIETVKAVSTQSKNVRKLRFSASSYTTSTGKIRLESTPLDINRKFSNRSKSAARTTAENKENIPQTSKKLNTLKKESKKIGKGNFMGQKTDVFVAHLKENSPLQSTANTLSKHKTQKSNVNNMPKAIIINEKESSPPRSPSPSLAASVKFDTSLSTIRNDEVSAYSQTSNMVLVIEPQSRELHLPVDTPKLNVINHRSITDWIDNINKEAIESQNITTAMRGIIEETLDFIDDPFCTSRCMIDSESVILSVDNLNSRHDLTESPTSFKTIIAGDDNYNNIILPNDIDFALNQSFDVAHGDGSNLSLNDTRLTITDLDALSFLTSESKISGYLSADNEFSSSTHLPECNVPIPNSTSVLEIFERKEQPFQTVPIQNIAGSLANQAFSGFTINEDPVSGDQPDLINFIDSEAGSLAVDVARQAASEELMISGRSSDTFESCVLDDDTVVPNWLFQMISHQQSAMDEIEPPAELMGGGMPDDEPMFDDNGNILDVPGQGAGAGDGRGMHSDQSQDSSGRGTSVSSSEFSSGPESEGILVDPSAYAAQFEMLRDAVASSVVVVAMDDPSGTLENLAGSRQGPIESESLNFSRGESRRPRALRATASDVDADVSSLDTDVPDSSDN